MKNFERGSILKQSDYRSDEKWNEAAFIVALSAGAALVIIVYIAALLK